MTPLEEWLASFEAALRSRDADAAAALSAPTSFWRVPVALGVPALVIDEHARPGDRWRSRYKSLCRHDPVWYDHLPYPAVPAQLAGVLPEGQDRGLAPRRPGRRR